MGRRGNYEGKEGNKMRGGEETNEGMVRKKSESKEMKDERELERRQGNIKVKARRAREEARR